SPEFEQVFARVREGLQWLFQTKQDVLVFASSGTGAMEASFVNFLKRGDTVIVVDGGKFGERWGKFAKAYGVNAVVLKCEWGHPVEPAAVEKALRETPAIKAVYVQANESSTGVYHPGRERDNQEKTPAAWTPAISRVSGIDESRQLCREEGLGNVVERHQRMARAARAGMQALGRTLCSKSPSPAMTTVEAPAGVDSEK